MREITLVLPYPTVSGNHSVRHYGGRHYVSGKSKDYRNLVASTVMIAKSKNRELKRQLPLSCLFDLNLEVNPPDRRRRDKDNMEKTLLDACTLAGVWTDDSLIADKIHRHWGEPMPGGKVRLKITPRS